MDFNGHGLMVLHYFGVYHDGYPTTWTLINQKTNPLRYCHFRTYPYIPTIYLAMYFGEAIFGAIRMPPSSVQNGAEVAGLIQIGHRFLNDLCAALCPTNARCESLLFSKLWADISSLRLLTLVTSAPAVPSEVTQKIRPHVQSQIFFVALGLKWCSPSIRVHQLSSGCLKYFWDDKPWEVWKSSCIILRYPVECGNAFGSSCTP